MSEADDQTTKAFPKPINFSHSTASAQAITSCSDLPDETLVPVVMPASQVERAVAQYIRGILKELEVSRQTVQRQQILIDTLTAQLESSQEQVAQVERECSHVQDSYNKQSHQLIQTENTCRELRTRLTRQQLHTLQFKVALEKCTEEPVASYQSQADTDVISFTTGSLDNLKAPYSSPFVTTMGQHNLTTFCFLKAQPIAPWSAQLQFFTNEPEPVLSSPSSNLQNIWAENSASCFTSHSSIFNWSDKYLSTPSEEEPLVVLETHNLNSKMEVDLEGRWEEIAFYPKSWKCTSSSCGKQAAAIDLEIHSLEVDISEFEAHRQELASLIKTVEELLTTDSEAQNASSAHSALELQTEPKLNNLSTFNTKLPSVVVYPLRPPKGRKSLAEIELPPLSQKSYEFGRV